MDIKHIFISITLITCNIVCTMSQTHIRKQDKTEFVSDRNGAEQIYSDINRLPYGTKTVVLQIHADKPGDDCTDCLFSFPTAHINNLAGTMPRHNQQRQAARIHVQQRVRPVRAQTRHTHFYKLRKREELRSPQENISSDVHSVYKR